jgi:hypothetical protein
VPSDILIFNKISLISPWWMLVVVVVMAVVAVPVVLVVVVEYVEMCPSLHFR